MEDRPDDGAQKRVDEAWKEEVRREKERAPAEEPRGRAARAEQASFAALIQQLGTQALLSMGLAARPGQEPAVDLPGARYVIDTLQMLEEKTRGNLTPEESKTLSTILAELRAGFVQLATRGGTPDPSTS